MSLTELALYVGTLLILAAFVIRRMAQEDATCGKEPICFVYPTTNLNRYVEKGGTRGKDGKWSGGVYVRTIPETPGFILENEVSRPAKPKERQPVSLLNWMLYGILGVYFYGIYPFRHMKVLEIPIAVDRVEGTNPGNWIDTSRGNELVSGIRNQFPRPFVFTQVELGDGFSIDLKLVPTFRVVVPYIVGYRYPNGGFFVKSASLLQSMVMDKLKDVATLEDFKGKPKGELGGLLADFITPRGVDANGNNIPSKLNAEMIKQVGLEIESIGITDWRASSEEVRRALEAAGNAIALGDAEIIKATKAKETERINAEKYAQVLGIQTKADADRQNALATSRSNYVRETVAALVLPGANPDVVSRGAADLLTMEAATNETSKLTTLVMDRAQVTVPVGGNK